VVRLAALVVLAALVFGACGGTSSHASPTSGSMATTTRPSAASPSNAAHTTTTTLPTTQWNAQYTTTTTGPCGTDPGAPTQTTERLAVRRKPDAAHPLEVLVVGDSVAETLLPSIALGFEGLGKQLGVPVHRVDSIAFPGFGFLSSQPGIVDGKKTNGFPQFANWRQSYDNAIAKYNPDVVIGLLGSWDMVPRVIDGRYANPTDCAWAPTYTQLVEQAYDHLTATGAKLIWLAFPCTARDYNPYHHTLNSTFHAVAANHPASVAYVDFDRFVCPNDAVEHSMRAPNGHLVAVRASDNAHFDFYSAPYVLSPYFQSQMARVLSIPR
jgi:hypothetical protein